MKTLLLAAATALFLTAGSAIADAARSVEVIHKDIWRRFVQPNGLLLDYNTVQGDIPLPTPDDAQNSRPNALSWGTPVENGAFFTGLYIDAAIRRWQMSRSDADKANATKLARGLMLCATVPNVPGFVARSILPDGKSYYALGSDDQTGPWFYGLWRYLRSGAAGNDEATEMKRQMENVADALHDLKWVLPTASHGGIARGQRRGSFADASYRGASRLLFIARAMQELTGNTKWKDRYEALARERLPNGMTRLELVAQGPVDPSRGGERSEGQLWLLVASQAMIAELAEIETDAATKQQLLASLAAVSKVGQDRIDRHAPPSTSEARWPSWRDMNAHWKPQTTSGDAAVLAEVQLRRWNNGRRRVEIDQLREPLSAVALVLIASPTGQAHDAAVRRLHSLLEGVAWEQTYTSFGFLAEVDWYLAQRKAR
jgi:hypothetical protein